MHDCCIRVTALLEYCRLHVSNTAGQRAKDVVFLCLFLSMLVVVVDF